MATLYTEQNKNINRTWLLMGSFLSFVVLIGYFASIYFQNEGIVYVAIFVSIVMNISGYWFSDRVALAVSHARPLEREENRELYRMVENLSITAGIPMPSLHIIDDPSPNAFATGRDKNHAARAVTTGLLSMMDKSELEGVLAHEMAHIGNRDILLQTPNKRRSLMNLYNIIISTDDTLGSALYLTTCSHNNVLASLSKALSLKIPSMISSEGGSFFQSSNVC